MFDDIFNTQMMTDLQKILREKKQTITCAESCTGGLIASLITEISGSSDIFNGSVVTYSNDVKMQEVHVKEQNLIDYGAVSEAVVADMCRGSLEKFDGDYSMAVSGVAGPTGGSEEKPVGTVYIGAMEKGKEPVVKRHNFDGDRKAVQMQSAKTALLGLYKIINR